MPDKSYYHVKWSGYAEVDGTRIEISSFDIEYALNAIPRATFVPVVGRDGRTGQETDAVDTLLDSAPYVPVKIYVKGETELDSPQGTDEPGFPYDEDTLIFDGVYQGVTYISERQLGSGNVVIGGAAAGWLVGLIGTSMHTNKTTVKGPGGFNEIATLGLSANPTETALFNISTAISDSPDTAVDDLWLEFIKPLFESIAGTEEVWGDVDNDSALEALGRMDSSEQFGDANTTLSLAGISSDIPKNIVGEWLAATLARSLFYDWRGASLWSALVNAAKRYAFHIVPLIDTATCAPVFGALGGDAYIIVSPDEYHSVNLVFQTPQLITKVVVIGNNSAQVSTRTSGPRVSAVVGVASADDISVLPYEGATILVAAPDWLGAEPTIGDITKVGLGKNKFMIPDVSNPEAGEYEPSEEENYVEIYNSFIKSGMGDAYARLLLLNQMLRDRRGTVTGRFRLDVAPGSSIAVEVIGGGKFSSGSTEPRYVYGLVNSVQLSMSGGSGSIGSASTKFTLSNVMTAQEHDGYSGLMTEEEHPMYEARFAGAKLTGE